MRDPIEVLAKVIHAWDTEEFGEVAVGPEIRGIDRRHARVILDALKAEDFEVVDSTECHAQIHHGPGHQSISKCERKGTHDVHECAPMGVVMRWRGDVGMTDFFNEAYVDD